MVNKSKYCDDLIQSVYSGGELLGEEPESIKKELRPLYFGLKNIVMKEIESIDREDIEI